ncbi:MAG: hypothetical protein LWX70_03655 [Sphingobacteriia bacterium]|nr:hypothetical protein [Sphingobacteriia bacterium]
MNRIISMVLLVLFGLSAYGQTASEALRYSNIGFGTTARATAMGGAFGALGGDFSSISINPAGLGVYRTSEIVVTPLFTHGSIESDFMGKIGSDDKYNFSIANFGAVLTTIIPDRLEKGGWKSVQFGVGMNRLQSFHNRMYLSGYNNENSLMTSYRDYANKYYTSGTIGDNGPESLAADANLLFFDDQFNSWFVDMPNGNVQQTKTLLTEGYQNEVSLSVSGNYDDLLYLGASVGIPFINYYEYSTYAESDINDSSLYFNNYMLSSELKTTGTGINLKLGAILRPADFVRIGLAYHTPTWYGNMEDNYQSHITSSFDSSFLNKSVDSKYGIYQYELQTPSRLIGSLAFIIGNVATISGDYTLVDYSNAKYRPTGENEGANSDIKNFYRSQNQFRVGAEYRLGTLSLRGGLFYADSPYRSGVNDGEQMGYSAGIGFKSQFYFVDLSWNHASYKEDYYLYTYLNQGSGSAPVSNNTFTRDNFMVTLGIKL